MRFTPRRKLVPWAMTSFRAALGPVLAAGASCNWSGPALAALVLSAFLSDIGDGVLARRWKCDTAAMRLFDSITDIFFYSCTAAALWVCRRNLVLANGSLLAGVLVTEAIRLAVDFAKFGKPASYHSYLAKTWGLTMAAAVMVAFATSHDAGLVGPSLWLGIACNTEGLAMSLILPFWRRDVRGLRDAWQFRDDRTATAPQLPAPAKSGR
jgi:phosphatidylglycerophosphate synthase